MLDSENQTMSREFYQTMSREFLKLRASCFLLENLISGDSL